MNTKSNKPMRAAGILLIAAMLTTCMTAGTFAKYTTSASGSDAARVAKFGVVTQIDGSLFGEEYAGVDATTNADNPIGYSGNLSTGTVQVYAQGTNVLAPGTKNDTGLAISLTGTPEVDVEVTADIDWQDIYLTTGTYGTMFEVENLTAENWESFRDTGLLYTQDTNGVFKWVVTSATYDSNKTYYQLKDKFTLQHSGYYPVTYKLYDGDLQLTNSDHHNIFSSLRSVVSAIESALALDDTTGTRIVQANTSLEEAFTHTPDIFTTYDLSNLTIKWEWAIEHEDNGVRGNLTVDDYNKADTYLGNLAAGDDFAGIPVKQNARGDYASPVEEDDDHTNRGNGADYSINTKFDLSITVTQVD